MEQLIRLDAAMSGPPEPAKRSRSRKGAPNASPTDGSKPKTHRPVDVHALALEEQKNAELKEQLERMQKEHDEEVVRLKARADRAEMRLGEEKEKTTREVIANAIKWVGVVAARTKAELNETLNTLMAKKGSTLEDIFELELTTKILEIWAFSGSDRQLTEMRQQLQAANTQRLLGTISELQERVDKMTVASEQSLQANSTLRAELTVAKSHESELRARLAEYEAGDDEEEGQRPLSRHSSPGPRTSPYTSQSPSHPWFRTGAQPVNDMGVVEEEEQIPTDNLLFQACLVIYRYCRIEGVTYHMLRHANASIPAAIIDPNAQLMDTVDRARIGVHREHAEWLQAVHTAWEAFNAPAQLDDDKFEKELYANLGRKYVPVTSPENKTPSSFISKFFGGGGGTGSTPETSDYARALLQSVRDGKMTDTQTKKFSDYVAMALTNKNTYDYLAASEPFVERRQDIVANMVRFARGQGGALPEPERAAPARSGVSDRQQRAYDRGAARMPNDDSPSEGGSSSSDDDDADRRRRRRARRREEREKIRRLERVIDLLKADAKLLVTSVAWAEARISGLAQVLDAVRYQRDFAIRQSTLIRDYLRDVQLGRVPVNEDGIPEFKELPHYAHAVDDVDRMGMVMHALFAAAIRSAITDASRATVTKLIMRTLGDFYGGFIATLPDDERVVPAETSPFLDEERRYLKPFNGVVAASEQFVRFLTRRQFVSMHRKIAGALETAAANHVTLVHLAVDREADGKGDVGASDVINAVANVQQTIYGALARVLGQLMIPDDVTYLLSVTAQNAPLVGRYDWLTDGFDASRFHSREARIPLLEMFNKDRETYTALVKRFVAGAERSKEAIMSLHLDSVFKDHLKWKDELMREKDKVSVLESFVVGAVQLLSAANGVYGQEISIRRRAIANAAPLLQELINSPQDQGIAALNAEQRALLQGVLSGAPNVWTDAVSRQVTEVYRRRNNVFVPSAQDIVEARSESMVYFRRLIDRVKKSAMDAFISAQERAELEAKREKQVERLETQLKAAKSQALPLVEAEMQGVRQALSALERAAAEQRQRQAQPAAQADAKEGDEPALALDPFFEDQRAALEAVIERARQGIAGLEVSSDIRDALLKALSKTSASGSISDLMSAAVQVKTELAAMKGEVKRAIRAIPTESKKILDENRQKMQAYVEASVRQAKVESYRRKLENGARAVASLTAFLIRHVSETEESFFADIIGHVEDLREAPVPPLREDAKEQASMEDRVRYVLRTEDAEADREAARQFELMARLLDEDFEDAYRDNTDLARMRNVTSAAQRDDVRFSNAVRVFKDRTKRRRNRLHEMIVTGKGFDAFIADLNRRELREIVTLVGQPRTDEDEKLDEELVRRIHVLPETVEAGAAWMGAVRDLYIVRIVRRAVRDKFFHSNHAKLLRGYFDDEKGVTPVQEFKNIAANVVEFVIEALSDTSRGLTEEDARVAKYVEDLQSRMMVPVTSVYKNYTRFKQDLSGIRADVVAHIEEAVRDNTLLETALASNYTSLIVAIARGCAAEGVVATEGLLRIMRHLRGAEALAAAAETKRDANNNDYLEAQVVVQAFAEYLDASLSRLPSRLDKAIVDNVHRTMLESMSTIELKATKRELADLKTAAERENAKLKAAIERLVSRITTVRTEYLRALRTMQTLARGHAQEVGDDEKEVKEEAARIAAMGEERDNPDEEVVEAPDVATPEILRTIQRIESMQFLGRLPAMLTMAVDKYDKSLQVGRLQREIRQLKRLAEPARQLLVEARYDEGSWGVLLQQLLKLYKGLDAQEERVASLHDTIRRQQTRILLSTIKQALVGKAQAGDIVTAITRNEQLLPSMGRGGGNGRGVPLVMNDRFNQGIMPGQHVFIGRSFNASEDGANMVFGSDSVPEDVDAVTNHLDRIHIPVRDVDHPREPNRNPDTWNNFYAAVSDMEFHCHPVMETFVDFLRIVAGEASCALEHLLDLSMLVASPSVFTIGEHDRLAAAAMALRTATTIHHAFNAFNDVLAESKRVSARARMRQEAVAAARPPAEEKEEEEEDLEPDSEEAVMRVGQDAAALRDEEVAVVDTERAIEKARQDARDGLRMRILYLLIGLWHPNRFDDLYMRVLTPAGVQCLGGAWEFMQSHPTYRGASMYDAIASNSLKRTFARFCAAHIRATNLTKRSRDPTEFLVNQANIYWNNVVHHLKNSFVRIRQSNDIKGKRDLWKRVTK